MIEIYGKPGCIWCERSVALLDTRNISYKYYTVGLDVDLNFIKDTFPDVKVVPIIVINGFRIGGYESLEAYVEETAGGYAHNI
jgi:glutaredoxin